MAQFSISISVPKDEWRTFSEIVRSCFIDGWGYDKIPYRRNFHVTIPPEYMEEDFTCAWFSSDNCEDIKRIISLLPDGSDYSVRNNKRYRTKCVVEELWVKVYSKDTPYSAERVYEDEPSKSPVDDENSLKKAIGEWESKHKETGLVPKPIMELYYKPIEYFTKEERITKA